MLGPVGTSGSLQVSSYYVLQHRTLSTGLTAHHDYLGKIDRVLYSDSREDILELVHQSAECVSTPAQDKGWCVGGPDVMRPGSEMPPCAAIFAELGGGVPWVWVLADVLISKGCDCSQSSVWRII